MSFKLWIENVEKRRIIAPVGSEYMEQLVKKQPFSVDFGKFKETWYLFFTKFQSSNIEKEGENAGGGRIVVSTEPETDEFDSGVMWIYHNGIPTVGLYYMPDFGKIAEPHIIYYLKQLKINHVMSDVNSIFAANGFKIVN